MKSIRFFKYALWTVVFFLFLNSAFSVSYAQAVREINGTVSYKIGSVYLSQQEAATKIAGKERIPLLVSLVYRGDWVTVLDAGQTIRYNASYFGYAIAEGPGTTDALEADPSASIYADAAYTTCDADLVFPGYQSNVLVASPGLEQKNTPVCPLNNYGLDYTGVVAHKDNPLVKRGKDAEGDYYEVPLFYAYFRLDRPETVYVRGVDVNGTYVTDDEAVLRTTLGETTINMINPSASSKPYYWPGCPNPDVAEWTKAPTQYYGGVIPGGIFIESSAEITDFKPAPAAGQTLFCDGDDITLTATVEYPSGKKRNEYTMELWWKSDYQVGGSRTALAVLDGRNNSATGHCAAGGTDCVKLTATGDGSETNTTFTITVPRALYDVQTPITGDGETDHLKKFTFVVHETGTSSGAGGSGSSGSGSGSSGSGSGSGASADPVTADTPAETANLPKIYLNVGELVLTTPGYARTDGTPFDKIEGITPSTTVYLRNDCDLHMVASATATSCYYQTGSTLIKLLKSAELFYTTQADGLGGYTSGGTGTFTRTSTTMGSTEAYYYNKLTWENGCVSETDTVLLVPRKELPAPSLDIFSDCQHLADAVNPFRMQASTESSIDVKEWQWVIRAEDATTVDLNNGIVGSIWFPHANQGQPCTDSDPDADPRTETHSGFGGGWIFDVGSSGLTKDVDNTWNDGSTTYQVKFKIAFTHEGSSSKFSVQKTAGNNDVWPTLIGQWLPSARDLSPNGANTDYEDNVTYTYGESKFVYVRYITASGDASPWQVAATGDATACNAIVTRQNFGITVKNDAHCPGTQISKETDILSCKTCTTDMTAEAGTQLQFYLTSFAYDGSGGACGQFAISGDEKIEFIATDDDGNETVFASIEGPQTFGISNKDDAYACDPEKGTVLLIPAPTLYTVTKSVKVRAAVVHRPSNTRFFSGWYPDATGKVTIDHNCMYDLSFNVSGGASVLNDEYVRVEFESNVKLGKLEAKRDGTVILTDDAMCVGSELELALTGDVDIDATWEWQEYNGSTYVPITGATGTTYKYVPDKTEIINSSNPDDYYQVGLEKKFRLVVRAGTESKTHDFAVKVFWAEKYVIGTSGVTPGEAITSGVCEGTDVTVKGTPADGWGWVDAMSFEYLEGSWTEEPGLKPTQNTDLSYQSKLETIQQQYWNNYAIRFKSISNTSNAAVTCVAYSDTVTLKVNKLEAGTITAGGDGQLCIGLPNILTYSGGGDSIAWYKNSALTDPTEVNGILGTGRTITVTPTGAAGATWQIDVKAFLGRGESACKVEANGSFKLKDCNIVLTPSPSSFCEGDATKTASGIKLTMGKEVGSVDKLEVSTDGGTNFTTVATSDYAVNLNDGGTTVITLSAAYAKALAAGTYKYKATVTTTEGTANVSTELAQVIVNALPVIADLTTTPSSTTGVCEGVDLTFTANATASGANLTYEWYYAASEADANSQLNSTKVTADAMHVNPTGKTLTLKTKGNQATLNGRWYYAKVTAVSTGSDGCTKEAYTAAAQAVIHPLPDTVAVVTGVKIGGQAVSELYTCAGKGTTMEVTTNGGKVPTGGSFTYSWTKGGGALPSDVMKTDLADNAGSRLTFNDAAATTANSGTYTLSLTVTTDQGCTLTLKRDLKIHFETCAKDKVKDNDGTEHTATNPFVLCANDATWPDVKIEAADLTDGAGGMAKVTKITLYHSTASDMTGEAEAASATPPGNNIPPLKDLTFDVDDAATDAQYKTSGSHYYRGKIERDGYAPTYTDIVEYVIGAVPVRTLTGSVQASSHRNGLSDVIDAATVDLEVCAGLVVELELSVTPADGSLTDAGGKGGAYKWYRNQSLTASTTAPDDPTGLTAVAGANATTSLGQVAAGGNNDGLYFAYRQYTRETAIHTGSVSTKQCTTLVKVPEGAKVKVKPMPSKPTAIAGATKELCDGDVFDLTTTTTPASAADGAKWTYRWYKRAHGESTDKPFNPTDFSTDLPDLNPIQVTASVGSSTSTITDVYKLKVYTGLNGCYDSTALLSGITVKIAPRPSLTKPTITPSETGGAVCAGSSLTLTAATTPTPSGATLHYRWFKLKGAAADTLADAPPVGTDAATYTISSAAAADAGQYYVRVLAVSGSCEAKALSDLTTVTVKPLPAPTYVQKIDGVSQTTKSVCKESEPTLSVEASVPSGSPTYSYAWQNPASGTASSYKVPQSATAADGTLTYKVKVKATENDCPSAEQTLTFTVKVVDCSNDLIEDGHSKGFEVCAGETAAGNWPTVKITANDHAGADIDWIELYHHTANSATGGTLIAKLAPAAGTPEATLEFAPFDKTLTATPSTTLTPSFGSIDFKAPSSTAKHFYYAKVSRSGGTDVKTTAVMEYMVGAMPDKDIVLGTGANTVGILLSEKATLADAKANGDDNTLTLCAGQGAYLHLNNLPAAADLTAANTTLMKYDWYRNTSAYSGTSIPDDPTGMGTRFGSAATETLAAVTGISAQQKDYYYAYLSYNTSTKWETAGKSDKVCAATYAVQTEAVRIVNPLPSVPTVTADADKAVCENATFNLTANLNPAVGAKPADQKWTYRWYYTPNGGAQTQIDPDPATDAWGWGDNNALTGRTASAAGATSEVTDTYYIKVRVENTATGCVDSLKTPVQVQTIKVTPKPKFTAAPKLSTTDLTLCAEGSGSVTVTPNLATAPDAKPAYQWYKLQDGYSTPETGNTHAVSLVGRTGATLSFSNIAAADAGKYYVVVTATPTSASGSATGCTEVRQSDVVTVTVNPLPDVTFTRKINGVERSTLKTCTGETVELELVPDAAAVALNHKYKYTWPTATVDNITPADGSGNTTDGGSKAKVKASVMASTGTNTVTVSPIRVTTQKSCWKEYTGTQFTVIVSDCSKDEVLEPGDGGVDIPRSKTEPFSVCAGEKAWPAVKINAGNHADQTIKSMDLYHRFGTGGEFAKVTSATLAADAKEGDVTFAPLTATVSGQDFKTAGSHYYFALVKRDDGSAAGQILSTDTVEYVVGAMPSKNVVSGGTIALSLANGNGPATGDNDKLTLCAGPNTYLYTNNLPTALDGGATTYKGATWYQGKSGQVSPIPDEPSATAMTSLGTGDQAKHDKKDLGATSGITSATQTDYYYAYLKFQRATAFTSKKADGTALAAKTCDTVYPLASEGVRIVNPMPELPTKIKDTAYALCDGDLFDLKPTVTPAKPTQPAGDVTEWTYRWYKTRTVGTDPAGPEQPAYPASAGDAALDSPNQTGVPAVLDAGKKTTAAKDVYRLKVYATTSHCPDSADYPNLVTVNIKPLPYVDNALKIELKDEAGATLPSGKVCADGKIKLSVDVPESDIHATSRTFQWYKLRTGVSSLADRDPKSDIRLTNAAPYSGVTTKELTITGTSGADGYYYLAVALMTDPCPDTVLSENMPEIEVVAKPTVQIADTSLMYFVLCPTGEQTTLRVTLDATTLGEVAANTATVSYQWYKSTKANDKAGTLIPGATSNTLTVTANAADEGTTTYYNVKVTKAETAFACPTVLWLSDAWQASGNSGMAKDFTIFVRSACLADAIADHDVDPAAALTADTATAICHSTTQTGGKTFNLLPATSRNPVSKATWYYAPVEEQGGKLVMKTAEIRKAKTCTADLTTTPGGLTAACQYNPATDAAEEGGALLNKVGEWRIWIDVERPGSNMATTDTIHYVVRPNPTLTNEGGFDVILQTQAGPTTVTDWLVCQGTDVQLLLDDQPAFADNATGTEYRSDTVTYVWDCENCQGKQKSTQAVFKFQSSRSEKPAYADNAPESAAYQSDFVMDQEYRRRFERNTAAHPHAGMPTYNIVCPVVDAAYAPYVKTFRDTVFTSEAPAGKLADAADKTAANYCTSALTDASTLKLVFTPQATASGSIKPTPAAKVTTWEYTDKDTPAASDWTTWTDDDPTTPNELSITLKDGRFALPAAGKSKTYRFQAQVENGKCGPTAFGPYVLTFYGAPVAGTISVPEALCAGSKVKVDVANVQPADADVFIGIYDKDPGTDATATAQPGITTKCSGGATSWDAAISVPISKPTTYYVRYTVKRTNAACQDALSAVDEVTLYPTPEFTYTSPDHQPVCLTDGQTVDLTFTVTNADSIVIYSAPTELASKDAVLAGVTAGTVKAIHSVTAAEIAAGKVTLTYDGSNMSAQDDLKEGSRTYFHVIAKQKALTGVPAAAACMDDFAVRDIHTAYPVTKPVIGWNADASLKLKGPEESGNWVDVYLKGGENANDTLLYSAVKKAGAGNEPDYAAAKQEAFSANPYRFKAYDLDTLFVWTKAVGYNGCPNVESDTIRLAVQQSKEYVAEALRNVCAGNDIVVWIKPGSGQGGIQAGSYTWSYSADGGTNWTPVPTADVTVGALDSCKLVWPKSGLAAGDYQFRMAYTTGSGQAATSKVATVTVQAAPVLTSSDALDLPGATCEGTSFPIKLKNGVTASGKFNLQLSTGDTTRYAAAWIDKTTAATSLSYSAKVMADSGFYRLRVYTHEVCDTLVSYARMLAVNSKPNAGSLVITPAPGVCFDKDITVTVSGYSGTIADYEYHPSHTAPDNNKAPENPAADAQVWRSVTKPSTVYPFPTLGADFVQDANGNYPATWTLDHAKYGYTLRVKVTNGACPEVYSSEPVDIYDTVMVAPGGDPDDFPVVVDKTTGLPAETVTFTAQGQWAGAKYVDGSDMLQPTTPIDYRWRVSYDEGKEGTWTNLEGTGLTGITSESVSIATTFWQGKTKESMAKMRFRVLIMDACKDTVRTLEAKIVPQTALKVDSIEPRIANLNGCFFYGDTVILEAMGGSGQGRVSYHWRVGSSMTPGITTISTLDERGFSYRYGAPDSSIIYLMAPAGLNQAQLEAWWNDSREDIYVFVTDALNPAADLFDAAGHLKKVPSSAHYAYKGMCFRNKPQWTMDNDTICVSEDNVTFTLDAGMDLGATGSPVNITMLRFAVKPNNPVYPDMNPILAFGSTDPGIVNKDNDTYTYSDATVDVIMEMVDGKPSGKLQIKAKTNPSDYISPAFDSLLIRAIVNTDFSQRYDTAFAVLRIDQGVKAVTTTADKLTVCEGGTLKMAADVERYSPSILREITWQWYRNGNPKTPEAYFKGTSEDPAPKIDWTLNLPVVPTDSGEWELRASATCGDMKSQKYQVKVNVKPTWAQDLNPDTDNEHFCAETPLSKQAVLNVNWDPDITWQHAKTKAGPWTPVAADGTRIRTTVDDGTPNPGQATLKLEINPTYLSDSGWYRIAVKAPAGSVCAGTDFEESDTIYIQIDTLPILTIDPSPRLDIKVEETTALKVEVKNHPASIDETCANDLDKKVQEGKWMLRVPTAGKGSAYGEAVWLQDYLKGAGSEFFDNLKRASDLPDGSSYTLNIEQAPGGLDSISVFMLVENCCGEVSSDTVLVRISDNLAINSWKADTVCEGTTATLTVRANLTIKNETGRRWRVMTDPANTTDPSTWPLFDLAAYGATEKMELAVATLTIPEAPYAMDGWRFVLELQESSTQISGVMTLHVRPVKDLHVLVLADPNPASDYTGFNTTDLEATVYVGDAPRDNQLPEGATVLTDKQLELYGYTVFDWYQIAPGKAEQIAASGQTVNLPAATGGFATAATGDDLHKKTLTVKDLDYNTHDSTYYFAILRSGCFEDSEWANQQDGAKYEGRHSDTTVLRIYEDLIVEWTAESMYADTLPYGTTPEDLADMMLPTDQVIGVHLENRNPEHPEDVKHWISSAYYIKCADLTDMKIAVELRKGVQSEEDAVAIATRLWYYRTGPSDEWHLLVIGDGTERFGYVYADDGTEFYIDNTRRTLQVNGVTYEYNNGWQFMSIAMADWITFPDGHEDYRFKDTTPVLTLVISEPLPDDLAFLPDEGEEADCATPHEYRLALNAEHESYNYMWQIKTPDAADFTVIDSLTGKTSFAYGTARPEDDGTLVRAIVGNFCGSDTVEAEIRVMSVEISPDSGFCADRTYTLQATPKRAGDNPTYAWYINEVAVPDATTPSLTFDPAALPAGVTKAADGIYRVRVVVTRDEALTEETDPYQFVNFIACATATLTVYDLPVIDVTADATNLTVIDSTTVRVSGVEDGGTVSWTPADYLYTPDQPESWTKPMAESGSHWFTATVTSAHGCVASDSVEIVVASSFTYDSTHVVVLVPPTLPWLSDGEGEGDEDKPWTQPDTNVNIMVVGDTLYVKTCKNSLVFLTLFTSGGDPTLVYEWDEDGLQPLTEAELADMGYAPLPDTMAAFYLDGSRFEFGCTVTERDGDGLSVHMQGYISYYETEHVALEALPHMHHNRYYENQAVYLTAHPNGFDQYHFYRYDVSADERTGEQHGDSRHYKTSYDREDGAEQAVYVAVTDRHGCRSYDSVNLRIIALPNAMILNDPNYPEADVIFPEFEVEIHDSWGRMVKSMVDGLGWDGTYAGKQVEGGTYYYRVKLPTMDGFTYIKGAVTVFTKKK